MTVITVSRQFGSGGDSIVEQVCDLLGYRFMDKWLLQEVAGEVGLSGDEIVDFSEEHYKARTFFQSLFGPRQRVVAQYSSRTRDTTGAMHTSTVTLDEAQCVDLIRASVVAAYKRGNIVIVGRGSQAILADRPDVLHVRIEAPLEMRMGRISQQEQMTLAEARALIAQRDYAAAQYLERFFGVDGHDTLNYTLVINTSKCSFETAAQIIVKAAQEHETHPASKQQEAVVP
ncbi:MAG: cytidylate kinase-like family protein [Anaerolineae bacterium]|nr:cytidylate kinase-like family protein [Anaerolineae bacterium]